MNAQQRAEKVVLKIKTKISESQREWLIVSVAASIEEAELAGYKRGYEAKTVWYCKAHKTLQATNCVLCREEAEREAKEGLFSKAQIRLARADGFSAAREQAKGMFSHKEFYSGEYISEKIEAMKPDGEGV